MNPFTPTLRVVWEGPKFVFVNEKRLREVAWEVSQEDLKAPDHRAPVFPGEDSKEFIDFIGLANSINFAFIDFKTRKRFATRYKGSLWRGSFGMAAALSRAIDEGVPLLDSDFLENITLDKMREIFTGQNPMPMLKERTEIFREIGRVLSQHYEGHFYNLFEEGEYRAFNKGKGIVERLIKDFPSFCDVSVFKPTGNILEFHKRAQLLVIVYQGRALSSKTLEKIKDADDLGPPADYAVPQSLESLGILQYFPTLREMIQKGKIIPKDTRQEQEIRAQTVYAVVRLVEEVNKIRRQKVNPAPEQVRDGVNVLHIDYKLWSMKNPDVAYHLTPTIAY